MNSSILIQQAMTVLADHPAIGVVAAVIAAVLTGTILAIDPRNDRTRA